MLDTAYIQAILDPQSSKPKLLDICCGAGGATKGYQKAGFYVVGVDIKNQRNYVGDEFIKSPAIKWLSENIDYIRKTFVGIHASPPCQAFSKARIHDTHSDMITPLRPVLKEIGLPYIIENIRYAPLIKPTVLCGAMFGLGTYRDRSFETSFPVTQLPHPKHQKVTPMGRRRNGEEFIHVVGNFPDIEAARWAMGIDWMNRDELKEAIPPAYTSYVGIHLLQHLKTALYA